MCGSFNIHHNKTKKRKSILIPMKPREKENQKVLAQWSSPLSSLFIAMVKGGGQLGVDDRRQHFDRVSKAASKYLGVRYFDTSESCIAALRADSRQLWVTSVARNSRSCNDIRP